LFDQFLIQFLFLNSCPFQPFQADEQAKILLAASRETNRANEKPFWLVAGAWGLALAAGSGQLYSPSS